MDKEKAAELVIQELGKHHSRNDLIIALCEQFGFNWQSAETFVQEVESQHGHTIAKRQSPILIILGIGILIAGFALTLYNISYIIGYLQSPPDMLSYEGLFVARSFYIRIGSFITGLAMIAGGVIGLWRVVEKLSEE